METKNIEVKTILPVFNGFYNSIFEYNEELDEVDNYNDANGTNFEFEDFEFDYEDYYNRVAINLCNTIEEQLNEVLQTDSVRISFIGIDSPKYYNYRNDYIDIKLTFTDDVLSNIIDILQDNEEFKRYLYDNYTDISGFISYYSNDVDVWINKYMQKDSDEFNHAISSVLTFILINEVEDIESIITENSFTERYISMKLIK